MAVKTETLADINTVSGCSNFGCMAIDGKKAWGLKTDKDNEASVLYYCSDVNISGEPYKKKMGLLGTGNGMTCNSSYILFGCKPHKYIVRVPRGFKGDWSKAVKFTTPTPVGAIAYYSSYHHIVRVTDSYSTIGKQYDRFAIGKIDEEKGTMEYLSYFYVHRGFSPDHVQDIFMIERQKSYF